MRFAPFPVSSLIPGLFLTATVSLAVTQVFAAAVEITECGQTVSTDAVMVGDLVCQPGVFEAVAINLAAPGITLDMGGYTLTGDELGIGVRAMLDDGAADIGNVTVRNGTIESFLSALDLVNAPGAVVENMTIRNLEADDPDRFFTGMRVNDSQDVTIRDSFYQFLPVAHKEAIVLANSAVRVDGIEMQGGSVGVNFGGACDGSKPRTSGSVLDSLFVGVTIAGVLVQCTDDARIAHNEFDRNEVGVSAYGPFLGAITGLNVERNFMHYGYIGVDFRGVTGSVIGDNLMRNNAWRGIILQMNMGCPEVVPECFYATGNIIAGNTVLGSFIDLNHHENALGNTWADNRCQTREGAEIPECTILFMDGFEY